jgi:hypothetical protein
MGIAYYGGVFIPCWAGNENPPVADPALDSDLDVVTVRVTVTS